MWKAAIVFELAPPQDREENSSRHQPRRPLQASRCAHLEQLPQHYAQIVRCHLQQVSLRHFHPSAQPTPASTACLTDVSEAPLDFFTPEFLQAFATRPQRPTPIVPVSSLLAFR